MKYRYKIIREQNDEVFIYSLMVSFFILCFGGLFYFSDTINMLIDNTNTISVIIYAVGLLATSGIISFCFAYIIGNYIYCEKYVEFKRIKK